MTLLRSLLPATTMLLVLALLPSDAMAQALTLDLGGDDVGSSTGRILQIVALITILSLAPAILMMVTSFTRIVVVLSFLRSALGVQQTPPNSVLVSLALFLTLFIMMKSPKKVHRVLIYTLRFSHNFICF